MATKSFKLQFEMEINVTDNSDYPEFEQVIPDTLLQAVGSHLAETLNELDEYYDGFSQNVNEFIGNCEMLGYKFKLVDSESK